MRLFIAALIPNTVRVALAATSDALQRAVPDRTLRWVAPENYHITLLFLGEQPETRVPEIAQAMASASVGTAPFTLSVQGLGVFPHWSRPQVLWAGVAQGAVQLASLAAALERSLMPKPDGKSFHPHITLARLKTPCLDADALKKRLHNAVQRLLPALFGSYELRALSLMHSTLTPNGALYAEIERVDLSG